MPSFECSIPYIRLTGLRQLTCFSTGYAEINGVRAFLVAISILPTQAGNVIAMTTMLNKSGSTIKVPDISALM